MALTGIAQLLEAINRSRTILLTTKERYIADDLAALKALQIFLIKMGKQSEVVVSGIDPERLAPCLKPAQISPTINRLKNFQIAVDLSSAELDDLSYDIRDGKLLLHLAPKNGTWKKEDVTVGGTDYRFDLVICVGAPDLESLGQIFLRNSDFFYATPIINLDHDPANEHFGAMNVVDLTGAAVSEVIFQLISSIERGMIDESMATALLGGIMSKTKSYRTQRVTPKTLDASAQLLALGANQETVVQELWKTRTIPMLSLWGRALARLKFDSKYRLAWTTLTREDFLVTGTDDASLHDVIEELIANASEAELIMLIWESKNGTSCQLHTTTGLDVSELMLPFRPSGSKQHVKIDLPETDVVKTEQALLSHLQTTLPKMKK